MNPHWEHYEHKADIGLRGYGNTKAEAFEQIALALTAVMVDPQTIACSESVEIKCNGDDDVILLVEWLNAIIFEMATRHMIFNQFGVQLSGMGLIATIQGELFDPKRHECVPEVKAATYHQAGVVQQQNGVWMVQCIVDV